MRLAVAFTVALVLAVQLEAAGRVYLRYDLIAQQPDEAKAFQPACSGDFTTGGSAFSASAVAIPLQWDITPMAWIAAEVIMTARTEHDAARIRRYEWVKDEHEQWTTESAYTGELKPDLLHAPRAIGEYIKELWHRPVVTGAYYVLETRGCPVIFAAYLHGVTES